VPRFVARNSTFTTLKSTHELPFPFSELSGCYLERPLLPVSAPKIGAAGWEIHIGDADEAAAKVFPDVKEPDISTMSSLVCLSLLVLKRSKDRSLIPASSEDVQGLFLRKVRVSGGSEGSSAEMDVYERVGYFTTSYIAKSRTASRGRKALE